MNLKQYQYKFNLRSYTFLKFIFFCTINNSNLNLPQLLQKYKNIVNNYHLKNF